MLTSTCAPLRQPQDWGTTPAVIDCALTYADENDVAITIHTDTINESGFVDDSIAAMKGRTIHTYHSEGAGGGHAPDIIKVRRLDPKRCVVRQLWLLFGRTSITLERVPLACSLGQTRPLKHTSAPGLVADGTSQREASAATLRLVYCSLLCYGEVCHIMLPHTILPDIDS